MYSYITIMSFAFTQINCYRFTTIRAWTVRASRVSKVLFFYFCISIIWCLCRFPIENSFEIDEYNMNIRIPRVIDFKYPRFEYNPVSKYSVYATNTCMANKIHLLVLSVRLQIPWLSSLKIERFLNFYLFFY